MLFEAAVVVVLDAFSCMVNPEIVTKSEPMTLKMASLRLPAVKALEAVSVTVPEVVMVTEFVAVVVPVNEIE
jgi:hypothetical protein